MVRGDGGGGGGGGGDGSGDGGDLKTVFINYSQQPIKLPIPFYPSSLSYGPSSPSFPHSLPLPSLPLPLPSLLLPFPYQLPVETLKPTGRVLRCPPLSWRISGPASVRYPLITRMTLPPSLLLPLVWGNGRGLRGLCVRELFVCGGCFLCVFLFNLILCNYFFAGLSQIRCVSYMKTYLSFSFFN